MTDSLRHHPEGDRNPYDAVPWSRRPSLPYAGEPFLVGVEAARDYDRVAVEWQSGTDAGRTSLQRDGRTWSGQLGPFEVACRYRFVASSDLGEDVTEWFTASIPAWETVELESISVDGGRILASGGGHRLTLTADGPDRMRWSLGAVADPPPAAPAGVLDGWDARSDGSGGLTFSLGGRQLTLSGAVARSDEGPTAWRLGWQLQPDEHIYGTGERFDSFDQRGHRPDVRVYEQYKGQGTRTYFPLPWLLSTQGYGLAVDGAARVAFDLGATDPDAATVTVPGAMGASGTWHFGAPAQLLAAYLTDVGLPSRPPIWAFGPWMSGNEWDSERRVREVVERTEVEGIPSTVLVIEAWSDEATFYLFNDTEHDPVAGSEAVPYESMRHGGRWPDPKALVDWLHAHGVRVVLWQIPVLKDGDESEQHLRDIAHAESSDLCVGTTGGASYRNRGWWFPRSRVIDFTDSEAYEWWFRKRAYLLDDVGVDGFKTDGGEHLWGSDVVTADGSAGDEAANAYPSHYLGAYHRFMREHGREARLTFSRAGFTGAQASPAHWAGDEDSTWEAYRASLVAGLSAAASGVAFWSWDLAGFSGELPSAELYQRAAAMAAFCPIMQYHSEHNEHRRPLADRTPWNVAHQRGAPEVLETYRFHARLRMNLVPYLYGLGQAAAQHGLPLMRPLVLAYPDDVAAVERVDQFLLGPDLLVAPVLEPGLEEREVYLPAGRWWDLWTGAAAPSGAITARAPRETIPVFVRGGAAIPLWMPETVELGAMVGLPGDGSGRLVLMVLPGSARSDLFNPITGRGWGADVELDGNRLRVDVSDAPQGVTVWVRGSGGLDQRSALPAGDCSLELEVEVDER